jgi:PAP2 superfamily
MIVEDNPAQPVAQRNADRPMVGIVLLVGFSVLILVGSITVSGLRFANPAAFFVPFGGLLCTFILIDGYQLIRTPGNKRIIFFANMMIIKLIMSVTMMILQYSMAAFKAYPINDLIERIDRFIGFNWVQFASSINRAPYLSDILGWCYKNWMWEFVVVFALLSFLSRFEDLYALTFNYIIAGMGILIVSGFLDSKSFDSVAAYSIAGFHYPTGVSVVYLEKVERLRQGVDSVMDFRSIIGLVAFPSFHAGAAVLLATATRGLKWLWLPFLCFNELILLGTITEGGHDFADVVGGCLCVVAGMALAHAFRRSGIASRAAQAVNRVTAKLYLVLSAKSLLKTQS